MESIIGILGNETTKLVVTIISTLIGTVYTAFKIRSIFSKGKSHLKKIYLKEDVEIMNNLKDHKEEYEIVSAYVKDRLQRVYGEKEPEEDKHSPQSLLVFLGAVMIFSGIYLTYAIHESNQSWSAWWYIGTIYLVILGAYMPMVNSITTNRRSRIISASNVSASVAKSSADATSAFKQTKSADSTATTSTSKTGKKEELEPAH